MNKQQHFPAVSRRNEVITPYRWSSGPRTSAVAATSGDTSFPGRGDSVGPRPAGGLQGCVMVCATSRLAPRSGVGSPVTLEGAGGVEMEQRHRPGVVRAVEPARLHHGMRARHSASGLMWTVGGGGARSLSAAEHLSRPQRCTVLVDVAKTAGQPRGRPGGGEGADTGTDVEVAPCRASVNSHWQSRGHRGWRRLE